MRVSLRIFLLTLSMGMALAGCWFAFVTCIHSWDWWFTPEQVPVTADQTRIDYRIAVQLTGAGAPPPVGEALRTSAQLIFQVESGFAGRIVLVGLERADGSGTVVNTWNYSSSRAAVLENALGGCDAGCIRVFRGWADVANVASPNDVLGVSGRLSVPFEHCNNQSDDIVQQLPAAVTVYLTRIDADGGVDGGSDGGVDASDVPDAGP